MQENKPSKQTASATVERGLLILLSKSALSREMLPSVALLAFLDSRQRHLPGPGAHQVPLPTTVTCPTAPRPAGSVVAIAAAAADAAEPFGLLVVARLRSGVALLRL